MTDAMARTVFPPALVLIGALVGVGAEVGPARDALVVQDDPLGETVTRVVYLEQNWSPETSVEFYFTPQGSQIIPYDWFLALEQVGTTTLFRDNRNILKYRYLPQQPGTRNPDGLPVGFVADPGVGRRWLGMTCAACHTTEIHLGKVAYRVDGAPTHADIQGFLTDLVCALKQTASDPSKFERFAAKVLGTRNSQANRTDLMGQLSASIKTRVGYNLRNFPGYDPNAINPPTPNRFGRLDAVDAIVNEVYHHAVKAPDLTSPTVNTQAADAAVSYPCLWDTPQHDVVEWLGIAKSGGPLDIFALSRNVGEVIGVFGDVAIPETPPLLSVGYPSTVKMDNLGHLEDLLKSLWSPRWPADFPAINADDAAEGAKLYKDNCLSCHALIDRTDPDRQVRAIMDDTGTDRRASDNFFKRRGTAGKLEGVNVNFVPFTAKIPPVADADSMLSHVVIGVILGRFREAPPDALRQVNFRGLRRTDVAMASMATAARYKARPLNGVWATAPYLHNGSVPTLDALLRPAADRPASFPIGVRTFDPVRVGYRVDVNGFPNFQVRDQAGEPIIGNSNAGHEYGKNLSDGERKQLIEYLKTL